ncbi:MAG: exosortase/archaeosortase family protein [Gemmataceae bacterium]|nr:exosortase/archaeosortase family protein [Gemmataceae bacterium]
MLTLRDNRSRLATVVMGIALGGSVVWAFYPSLADMERRWGEDSHYSHGYLVPLFAVALLWLRRDRLAGQRLRTNWWGVGFLLAAVGLRIAGGFLYLDYLNQLALLPTLAGVCLLCAGWPALRWSWPAIVFLFFMIPLPYRVQIALGGPLQHLATWTSTYLLQTLGFPAVAEGNIIRIDDFQIGVVEACNGLGMLFTFIALATGLTLVVQRPLLDKLLILASSIPIAVAANVLRITATAALSKLAGNEAASVFFHDLAGWFMMPVALVLLLGELALLRRLLVDAPESAPIPIIGAAHGNTIVGGSPRKRMARRAAAQLR